MSMVTLLWLMFLWRKKRKYRRWRKRERARAGIEPTAAAPSQPDCPGVSRSDHSAGSKELASWRALELHSDRHGLMGLGGGRKKGKEQAEEAARTNRRRTKRRMAAERTARRDKYRRWRKRRKKRRKYRRWRKRERSSIPALALSLFLQRLYFLLFLQRLYFLLFLQRLYLSLRAVRSAAILFFVLPRFILAASSACFFPFFLPPPNPIRPFQFEHSSKVHHEADSFEPAEWSERLTPGLSGWLGAAAVGSIPALALSLFLQRCFFRSLVLIAALVDLWK